MERPEEAAVHRRMLELRLACERDIRVQREAAGRAVNSFRNSLRSIRSMADQTLDNRERLALLKDYLEEVDAELMEALAVKTHKEAARASIAESLSSTIARIKELREITEDQRARKDEYAAIISQQLLALQTFEEKSTQESIERENIEEAISWYNKVLGFRAEGGEGVKFIFNKIDLKNPDAEYSFTIRLDGDVYVLQHCNPLVEGIKELVVDLNKTNGLFKFVRIMREKFAASALNGNVPTLTSSNQDSSSFTVSSPPPVSLNSSSETNSRQNSAQFQAKDGLAERPKKFFSGKDDTPQSLTCRRSPRLKAKKFP